MTKRRIKIFVILAFVIELVTIFFYDNVMIKYFAVPMDFRVRYFTLMVFILFPVSLIGARIAITRPTFSSELYNALRTFPVVRKALISKLNRALMHGSLASVGTVFGYILIFEDLYVIGAAFLLLGLIGSVMFYRGLRNLPDILNSK